jgi:hypothetical protein
MAIISMFYGIIVSMYFFDNAGINCRTFTSSIKMMKL